MIASANRFNRAVPFGFVPHSPECVTSTLEFAYDDYCVAVMAKLMGKTDVQEEYENRSKFWKNVFDPETGFMRAKRSDGSWVTPFNPLSFGHGSDYTEGDLFKSWLEMLNISGSLFKYLRRSVCLFKKNSVFPPGTAWQHIWFVPHAVEQFVAAFGGPDKFEKRLDEFFNHNNEGFSSAVKHTQRWCLFLFVFEVLRKCVDRTKQSLLSLSLSL